MNCKQCSKEIENEKRKVFCSDKCANKHGHDNWKKENRTKYLEGKKVYREKTREKNREYFNLKKRQYRAANSGVMTEEQRKHLLATEKCTRCGNSDKINIHHIKPVRFGGKSLPENIMPLCFDCHMLWHKMLKGFWLEEA